MTAEQVIGLCVVMLLALVAASVVGYISMRKPTPVELLARLEKDLPELQAEFFDAGENSGRPHGLRWLRCDWEEEYALVRDRISDEVVALAAVVLHLTPEPGETEAEANPTEPRLGSAVFFHAAGRWQTVGKVVLNLRPGEVAVHYADQYEPLSGSRG